MENITRCQVPGTSIKWSMIKRLLKKQHLSKDELSASEMEESQVVARFLFPAHEKTARTVEPGMRSLHHPSPCAITRNNGFLSLFLPTTADMFQIAACSHQKTHERIVIASIQTQMLRVLLAGCRTSDDDPIHRGTKQLAVVSVGSINEDRQRNARSISQQAAFGPGLGAIGGIGAGRGTAERLGFAGRRRRDGGRDGRRGR